MDWRHNDRGASSQVLIVLSASGFAAGPVRKPGAAHLMNWFYQLPPYRIDSSRLEDPDLLQIIRSANHNMRLLSNEVKAQFHCRNQAR